MIYCVYTVEYVDVVLWALMQVSWIDISRTWKYHGHGPMSDQTFFPGANVL